MSTENLSMDNRFLDAADESGKIPKPIEGYRNLPIVSLETAVESIEQFCPDIQRRVYVAKGNSDELTDGLTTDEAAAIYLYTMEWQPTEQCLYVVLNSVLRSKDRDNLISPWLWYLKLLLTGLFKLKPYTGMVWRGVKIDISQKYFVGNTYTWWGFSSCSTSLSILESNAFLGKKDKRAIFAVECFDGRSIRQLSSVKTEDEVLLLPGTQFVVKGILAPSENDSGLTIIQLKQVRPPFTLLEEPIYSQDRIDFNDEQWQCILAALEFRKDSTGKIAQPYDMRINLPDFGNRPIFTRIHGSMIGMAAGDAVGVFAQFNPRSHLMRHPIVDMYDDEKSGLKAGQFTDATSMALCLAASLVHHRGFIPYDQLVRYKWWYRNGYMSSIGKSFNFGRITTSSIETFENRQRKFSRNFNIPLNEIDYVNRKQILDNFDVYCSTSDAAGNGALKRLAPVPLFFFRSPEKAVEYCGISGQLTHGDVKARDACRYYGALILAAIYGYSKENLLHENFYQNHFSWFGNPPIHEDVLRIIRGSYKKANGFDDGIRGSAYIIDTLEAALWAFWSTTSFRAGALAAVNLGNETSAVAATYGQLAGAFYGFNRIDDEWKEKVFAKNFIASISSCIYILGQNLS